MSSIHIRCDKTSAINFKKNPVMHSRTRQLGILDENDI